MLHIYASESHTIGAANFNILTFKLSRLGDFLLFILDISSNTNSGVITSKSNLAVVTLLK